MIDFRYHIVSLISVFLALAVGIILGAGPLEGPIGDQLTGQVESLRVERNDLREDLSESESAGDDAAAYIEAAGPQLVEESLADRNVAVISLGEVDSERFDPIEVQLDAAGATVTSSVEITDAWTGEDSAARISGADALTSTDETGNETAVDGDSTESDVDENVDENAVQSLAAALASALAAPDSSDSPDASTVLQTLSDEGLILVTGEMTERADVILLLSPPADPTAAVPSGEAVPTEASTDSATAETDSFPVTIESTIAVAAADTAEGTVVAGPAAVDGDLISQLRAEDLPVSTVSGVDSLAGQINVPLALAASASGVLGHYGFEDSATALIPAPVELAAPTSDLVDPGAPAATDQTPEGDTP